MPHNCKIAGDLVFATAGFRFALGVQAEASHSPRLMPLRFSDDPADPVDASTDEDECGRHRNIWHGTLVSGIIATASNNGTGVTMVLAPRLSLNSDLTPGQTVSVPLRSSRPYRQGYTLRGNHRRWRMRRGLAGCLCGAAVDACVE